MQGSDRGKQVKRFARLGGVGIELAVSTVVGMAGGLWLDAKLETKPWLTLIGLLLGVVAGFRNLIAAVQAESKRAESQAPESETKDQDREHD